jgi:2-keto-4-pentenoate hydratase/2-oxohepta-3-ene-1,7-dioic acid hydratase in catechol pathway
MRIEKGVAEEERSMRKSFSTFTPVGPWIVTADEVPDPHRLRNQLWIDGQLRQDANTAELIVGIPELIELISSVTALRPGDVIATGTPEGVGPFGAGARLRIAIESVGEMSLDVAWADAAPRSFDIQQGVPS